MSLVIKESYKTAVISTAHVTALDSERFPMACFDPISDRGLNWVHGTEYGWIVRIAESSNGRWKSALRNHGITWATIENIEKVLAAGFDAVHFDRDAELVDGLQSWEW